MSALPRSARTKLELLHVYRIITVVMYLPVSGGVFSATPESLPLDGQLEQNGVHAPQTDENESQRASGSNDQNTCGTLRWRKYC